MVVHVDQLKEMNKGTFDQIDTDVLGREVRNGTGRKSTVLSIREEKTTMRMDLLRAREPAVVNADQNDLKIMLAAPS